jgi:hypothetical protein
MIRKLHVGCALLLITSLFNLPMGYYTFLRLAVFLVSIFTLTQIKNHKNDNWFIGFFVIAVLFNPILPIHLNNKNIWSIIDLIVAVIFLLRSFKT